MSQAVRTATRPRIEGEREVAIFDATLRLLATSGYDRLTMDAVAADAKASKATLYRRWQTKADLVVDSLVWLKSCMPHDIPDTGSLRGDVLALLTEANKVRLRAAVLLFTRLGGFYQEANTNLAELGAYVQGGRDAMLDEVNQKIPLRRHAKPEEIAALFAYLASDDAAYATGHVYTMDGGETSGGLASR